MTRAQKVRILVACLSGIAVYLITFAYQTILERAESARDRRIVIFEEPQLRTPISSFPAARAASIVLTGNAKRYGIRAWAGDRYTPILRWVDVYEWTGDDGRKGYVAPDLLYDNQRGTPRLDTPLFRQCMQGLCAVFVAIGVFVLLTVPRSFIGCAGGLAALRIASLLWSYSMFGFFTVHAGDETEYYNIASRILAGDFTPWAHNYTVGNPLLYCPWLLLLDLPDFAFSAIYSFVSFVLYGLGAVLCLVWIVRRLSKQPAIAMAAGLMLVLYPWFMRIYHRTDIHGGMYSFFGLWFEQPLDLSFIDFFHFTDYIGYNAMSDLPAMCIALLGLILMHRRLREGKHLFWAGLLIGFSCLIRVAGIFYLLPAAYLWLAFAGKPERRRVWLLFLGMAVAALPQILWSWRVLGHPFVLGYQLHIDTEMGLQYLSSSIVLIGYAFSQLMTLAALGMLIQGRRHPHLTAMLALLIMPTMIFYCSYDAVGASAVRLMTLPLSAMMCAAVLIFHNTGESRRDLVLPIAAMVVAAMCIPGTAYLAYLIEVPVWATPAIGMAFAAVSALWRRDWRYTIFFLVVAAGYHVTTFAFLSIVCAWTVISAIRARFRSA